MMFARRSLIHIARQAPRAVLVRNLHLHEYQSLQLMRSAGLQVQNGNVAFTPDEAKK